MSSRFPTQRSVFEHILFQAKSGLLGAYEHGVGCVYVETDLDFADDFSKKRKKAALKELAEAKHCAVGCLLSPEQLFELCATNMNAETTVYEFDISLKDLPMSLNQLTLLQNIHDHFYGDKWDCHESLPDPSDGAEGFIRIMESVLAGGEEGERAIAPFVGRMCETSRPAPFNIEPKE
jgi:hypothetical protein